MIVSNTTFYAHFNAKLALLKFLRDGWAESNDFGVQKIAENLRNSKLLGVPIDASKPQFAFKDKIG